MSRIVVNDFSVTKIYDKVRGHAQSYDVLIGLYSVHRNLLSYKDIRFVNEELYLTSSKAECTLRELISENRNTFTETEIEATLSCAVSYLHSRMGVIHGDIKPENVFVYGREMKLADFGSCTGKVVRQFTSRYASPEALSSEIASQSMDVWSIGCVLYEVRTSKCLFPSQMSPWKHIRIRMYIECIFKSYFADSENQSTSPSIRLPQVRHCQLPTTDLVSLYTAKSAIERYDNFLDRNSLFATKLSPDIDPKFTIIRHLQPLNDVCQ